MTRGGTVPEKLKVLERGPKNIVGLQQTWGFMWNYIYIRGFRWIYDMELFGL